MDFFTPKWRRDPDAMVQSLYSGVSNGGTVTSVTQVHPTEDRLMTTRQAGPMMPRGQSGLAGVFIMGGLVTPLAEMEEILQARREKRFVPQRKPGEIVRLCMNLNELRNDAIKYFRKNPSEAPKKRRVRLYLPSGYRMADTAERGFRVRVRV